MNIVPSSQVFTIKRKMAILGQQFRVTDQAGTLVGIVKQKAFKLKEDIRVYGDENMTQEVMVIQARQIMDFSAAYDIWDSRTQQKLGALRRKGWSSIIRDEWQVLDPEDRELGKVIEDNQIMALLRRFLSNLIPQNFDMIMFDGRRVVDFRQAFNPFIYSMTIDFTVDPHGSLDKRMGIAAGILIATIEGRQK